MKHIKLNLLTGLIVLVPLVITIFVFWKLFLFVDGLLGNLLTKWVFLPFVGHQLPGAGFVLVVILTFIVGMIANNIIGKKFIIWLEMVLSKIPIMNIVYRGIQQISHAFLSDQKGFFKAAVLIRFPHRDIYSIAFITHEYPAVHIHEHSAMVTVFRPTTPNPTSGFFLIVPAQDIVRLEMSVEDALKVIISGGVIKANLNLAQDQ